MKNIIIILFLFLILGTLQSYSLNGGIVANNKTQNTKDSTDNNVKLHFTGNYYLPIENDYVLLDIKHGVGYGIGFILPFSKQIEGEVSLSFEKFKTSYSYPNIEKSFKGNIIYIGLNMFPYHEKFAFYYGVGINFGSYTESLFSKAFLLDKQYTYYDRTFVLKLGFEYRIHKKFSLEFSPSFNMDIPKFVFKSKMLSVGVIYDL
jgi:hypothetical protein